MTLFTTKLGETICLDLLLKVTGPRPYAPNEVRLLMVGHPHEVQVWLDDWNIDEVGAWEARIASEHARLLRKWEKVKLEVVR